MSCSRKYLAPLTEGFLVQPPPPLHPHGPLEITVYLHYFPLKILTFESPHLLIISNEFLWSGYGYFLELYNATIFNKILLVYSNL